jgi:hypothetical protein
MTASRIAIPAFFGLWTALCYGQIPPTPPGGTGPTMPAPQGQNTGSATKGQTQGNRNTPAGAASNQDDGAQSNSDPTKGPIKNGANTDASANGNQKGDGTDAGPEILDDSNATPEEKASAEYSGPAVLSRGISASEPMNPKNVKFTPTLGVNYVVNSGLTGVTVQSDGKLQDALSQGVQVTYGLVGEKVLKRDVFSLTFSGNYSHYSQQSGLDGTSDQLALTWRHKLSRHFSFGVRESLQEFNNNNLLLSGSQLITSGAGTTLVTATPATEAFDGRVFTLFNEGDITWQVNGRLSINFSGGGFMTRRASTSLYGDTGFQAGADTAYRLTRRTTVGVYYSYTHFDYIGIYGGTDVNTVGLTYSVAFNNRTQLITRIGGSRLETTGLQSVQLDPFLALLFGTPSTVEATYLKNYAPDLNLQLRHKVSDLALSLSYSRGVTPGNGVILTSIRQSAAGGVDYQTRRKWRMNGTGGWDTLSSFGVTNQQYSSLFLGASVYRPVMRHLDWTARLDFHHYLFDSTGFLRNSYVFSTGFVWSPGDLVEHLW